MKEFIDEEGAVWTASVTERTGPDYKARFILSMTSTDGSEKVLLEDVAWNSAHTAQRTLDTMSTVELRRRLRIGRGRTPSLKLP